MESFGFEVSGKPAARQLCLMWGCVHQIPQQQTIRAILACICISALGLLEALRKELFAWSSHKYLCKAVVEACSCNKHRNMGDQTLPVVSPHSSYTVLR